MQIPVAQGLYVPAVRHNDLIFVSGMTPRRNGVLEAVGPVEADRPVQDYSAVVELAARNAVAAAKALLVEEERLAVALSLSVFVNSPPGYTFHSQLADIASCYLLDEVGVRLGSRAAVGTSSLPGNATVELCLVFVVAASSDIASG